MSLARNDPRHGTANGYSNLGCRCHACGAAATAYARERGVGGYTRVPCPSCGKPKRTVAAKCRECENALREAPHGTPTRYKRCRCDECKRAAADTRRKHREKTRVPCSHGCGTMVDSTDRRYPDKPYECRSCAIKRINAAQKARALA